MVSEKTQVWLLQVARRSLEYFLETKAYLPYDTLTIPREVSAEVAEPQSAFVVLTVAKSGLYSHVIRGVNGVFESNVPLGQLISQLAVNAGFFDPRTPRIKAYELNDIKISLQLPREPEPLPNSVPEILEQLDASHSGVIARFNDRMTYVLPYVWDDMPDAELVLRMLRLQLGIKKDIADTSITYESFLVDTIEEASAD